MIDRLKKFCKELLFVDTIYGMILKVESTKCWPPVDFSGPGFAFRMMPYLLISGAVRTPSDETVIIRGEIEGYGFRKFGKPIYLPATDSLDLQPNDIIIGIGKRKPEKFLLDTIDLVWRYGQGGVKVSIGACGASRPGSNPSSGLKNKKR